MSVVEIAKEVLSTPEGMKELGLPTTIEGSDKKPMVMSAEDWANLFDEWIANWNDIVEFEIVPVISSSEAAERAKA